MKLLTAIIVLLACQTANAWQWRITERGNINVTCVNGQCVPATKYQTPVVNDTLLAKSIISDCPDGRCPLLPKLSSVQKVPSVSNAPTLAPPDITPNAIAETRPILKSVMVRPVQRVRMFSGRVFSCLRCR